MEFKRISDAELVQVSEETNLLVEVNGEVKRTSSTEYMNEIDGGSTVANLEALKNLAVTLGCAESVEDVTSGTVAEAIEFISDNYTSGVSSWNDLTDKPFGEESICIFDKTLEFAYDAPIGGYTSYLEEPLDVHDKDEVIVEWDGKQYECVAGSPSPGVLLAGNASAMGAQDTGEPFLYLFITNEYDETQIAFYTPSNATPNTHSVKVYTNTVKTLDPKFVPGGAIYRLYPNSQRFLFKDKDCTQGVNANEAHEMFLNGTIIVDDRDKLYYYNDVSGIVSGAKLEGYVEYFTSDYVESDR